MKRLVLLCLVTACVDERAPDPVDEIALPGIGETCGADEACAGGLACLHYAGIAGPSGPTSSTCEQRCKDDGDCADGRSCVTITDGPGRVCR